MVLCRTIDKRAHWQVARVFPGQAAASTQKSKAPRNTGFLRQVPGTGSRNLGGFPITIRIERRACLKNGFSWHDIADRSPPAQETALAPLTSTRWRLDVPLAIKCI